MGLCERVLEGHRGEVNSVAFHPDGRWALSGSDDNTVRLWDLVTGGCEVIGLGRTAAIWTVAFDTRDSCRGLSIAEDGRLQSWDMDDLDDVATYDSVFYTNAKVVLVGESEAGKSGLAQRIAHDRWGPTESTLGAWASHLQLPPEPGQTHREIWLWDFGGQADQRLIHQLYLGDTAVAVLVFNGQREDVLVRLWDWDRALGSNGDRFPKLLAAGRIDRYPLRASRAELDAFCADAGFDELVETSAKEDIGCSTLREKILAAIDWSRIPWRSSPEAFQELKREILRLKDSGRALTSIKELRDWLPTQVGPFDPGQLNAVGGLLSGPGAVMPLGFGDYVLLQPELMNTYAQAVIQTLRDDPHERGCVTEERVLRGDLAYDSSFQRLPEADEHIVLHAMHKQLVERSICLRDLDAEGRRPTLLVFPSYFRRERPDRPKQPPAFMTYRLTDYLDELYASLVVRLHHSDPFKSADLWRNAADFETPTGKTIGIRLSVASDGEGTLEVHCENGTPMGEQVIFAKYVDDHLRARTASVTRLRTYICASCSTPVENRDAAHRRLMDGKPDIGCALCDRRIALWDDIEEKLASPELRRAVDEMRRAAEIVLDTESRERVLVGEVYALVARANQIAREMHVSDHGIDMEMEFKDHEGKATGRKLYLQLKSGDSYLRIRKEDSARIFRIPTERHANYWIDQSFPVMLVTRTSAGEIEWMEISAPLRRERDTGRWPVKQLVFKGERLDVLSILRWRDRLLGSTTSAVLEEHEPT